MFRLFRICVFTYLVLTTGCSNHAPNSPPKTITSVVAWSLWPLEEIQECTESIRANPEDYGAYHNRGLAKRRLGDLHGAFTDFDTSIRLYPHESYAYFQRGITQAQLGKLDLALDDFNHSLKLNPDDSEVIFERAEIYKANGLLDKAEQDYTTALKMGVNEELAVRGSLMLSLLYTRRGDFKRAIGECTGLTQLRPNDPRIFFYRARAYYLAGEYEQAFHDIVSGVLLTLSGGGLEDRDLKPRQFYFCHDEFTFPILLIDALDRVANCYKQIQLKINPPPFRPVPL